MTSTVSRTPWRRRPHTRQVIDDADGFEVARVRSVGWRQQGPGVIKRSPESVAEIVRMMESAPEMVRTIEDLMKVFGARQHRVVRRAQGLLAYIKGETNDYD